MSEKCERCGEDCQGYCNYEYDELRKSRFSELIATTYYEVEVDENYVWEEGGCKEPNCTCNAFQKRLKKEYDKSVKIMRK